MSSNSDSPRISQLLAVGAGLALIGTTFLIESILDGGGLPTTARAVLVVSGCGLVVLGVLARQLTWHDRLAKAALAVLSACIAVSTAEAAFRFAGYNFDTPNPAMPIFNRSPSYHDGDGIMRRPGPAVWRGRPLNSIIHLSWGNANAYPDEPELEIHYDRLGFRNPPDLKDWEVVVTGDSFVESGYLAYEDMFTTVAARRLGIRIKNLGVSDTGTIFQTAYVRKYGKAPSTRHAVLCFFDGNDYKDVGREADGTNFIRRTGHRIGHRKQTSLLRSLQQRVQSWGRPAFVPGTADNLKPNAYFVAGDREHPATLRPFALPAWEELTPDRQRLIAATLANWGQTVRALGLQPWVMSIPDSSRMMPGRLRFVDTNSAMTRWKTNHFGAHLAKICATNDIRFINAWDALLREFNEGRVPYNLVGDGHLSVEGSRVVAAVLSEALRPALQASGQTSAPPVKPPGRAD